MDAIVRTGAPTICSGAAPVEGLRGATIGSGCAGGVDEVTGRVDDATGGAAGETDSPDGGTGETGAGTGDTEEGAGEPDAFAGDTGAGAGDAEAAGGVGEPAVLPMSDAVFIIGAPQLTQKRQSGGLGERQAEQIVADASAVAADDEDVENENAGAAGRKRDDIGLAEPGAAPGSPGAGASAPSRSALACPASREDTRASTLGMPLGGVGGTPRAGGFNRRPQS